MDTKILYAKLATVPPPIRTHLGSEETIDMLEKIERQFHLLAGSLGATKLIQKLQIKEIGPEYFAGELAAALKLEKNNALLVSGEIEKSIFMPIRKDFSDYGIDIDLLNKFQIPAIKSAPASNVTQTSPAPGPKIIAQGFEAKLNASPAVPKPVAITMPIISSIATSPKPQPTTPPTPPQAAPIAKPNQDKGWSKQGQQDPVVKLGIITPSIPKPTPATSIPVGPQPMTPMPNTGRSVSEFDRLDYENKGIGVPPVKTTVTPIPPPPQFRPSEPKPQPTSIPIPKPPTAQPAPMMLHQVGSAPSETASRFQVDQKMQNQINSTVPPTSNPNTAKPAVLEFAGDRPPAPAQPPKPQTKVIVKDFLTPENPPTPPAPTK